MILDATGNIETVMGFDPHFQSFQQPHGKIEVSPSHSASLFVLWFTLLLAQALMFWKQKK